MGAVACSAITNEATKKKATVSYTFIVPVGSSDTAAVVKPKLTGVLPATLRTEVTSYANTEGKTVTTVATPEAVAITADITEVTSTAKVVSGKFSVTLASETMCNLLKSDGGKTAMQKLLKDNAFLATTTAWDHTKIPVTVTCTANRRLSSEGRKLGTYKGEVSFTFTVPAGSSASATKVASSLNAVTADTLKAQVTSYANAKSKTVTPTAAVKIMATVVTTTTTTTTKKTNAITKKTNATTSTTTAAASTAAKKVSGSLSMTLATKTQCDDLASTAGKTAMQKMLRDKAGLASTFDLTKIDVTVTCTANRRLSSEGRKMSTYTGKVGYAITVPAGHSVSATKVASNLNAVTADTWKSAVKTYAAKEGKTITPTAVTATKAGVTEINETSFAKSTSLMLGLMMIFRALL